MNLLLTNCWIILLGLQPFGSGHYVMIKWSQWSETMEWSKSYNCGGHNSDKAFISSHFKGSVKHNSVSSVL